MGGVLPAASSLRVLRESHSCSGERVGARSEETAQLGIGGGWTDPRPCLGAYGGQPDPGTVSRGRGGQETEMQLGWLVVPTVSSGPASLPLQMATAFL